MDDTKANSSDKTKISLKDSILAFIGFLCIPIFGANASEFLAHRRTTDLGWCSLILIIYFVCLFFVEDRIAVTGGQFGALALFGTVNSILRRTLVAAPAILVCGLIAFLFLLWEAKRTKPRRENVGQDLGKE